MSADASQHRISEDGHPARVTIHLGDGGCGGADGGMTEPWRTGAPARLVVTPRTGKSSPSGAERRPGQCDIDPAPVW